MICIATTKKRIPPPPFFGNIPITRTHQCPRPVAEQSYSSSGRMWLMTPIPLRSKFPSAEGCREAAGWFITRSLGEGWFIARSLGKGWHEQPVTPPLSLRRSMINVENVGVYDCGNPVIICLRANARSAFLFTGSPRSFHSARDDKGD